MISLAAVRDSAITNTLVIREAFRTRTSSLDLEHAPGQSSLTETKVAAVYAAANTPAGFEDTDIGSVLEDSDVKCARTISTDRANSTSSLSMAPFRRPGDVRVCVLDGVVTL